MGYDDIPLDNEESENDNQYRVTTPSAVLDGQEEHGTAFHEQENFLDELLLSSAVIQIFCSIHAYSKSWDQWRMVLFISTENSILLPGMYLGKLNYVMEASYFIVLYTWPTLAKIYPDMSLLK